MDAATQSVHGGPHGPADNQERRQVMIAEAAYFRAERRGFEAGHALEDWLAAEAEVDGVTAGGEVPVDPYLPRFLISSDRNPSK